MTALARAGWRTLTLADYARRVGGDPSPPGAREFLLTFDDGYASLTEHVYPLLAGLEFTATTFVITDYVGDTNRWDMRYTWRRLAHLTWGDIERWHARGFSFASHGAAHERLTWLSDADAADDLGRSRATVTARLGDAAGRAVAYPFGAVNQRVLALTRAAGYELGFGGVRGNGDLLHLARVPVYMWDAGAVPCGLRDDAVGALGRAVAHVANRCAVGTSVLKRLGLAPRQRSAPPPE